VKERAKKKDLGKKGKLLFGVWPGTVGKEEHAKGSRDLKKKRNVSDDRLYFAIPLSGLIRKGRKHCFQET